LSLRTVALVAVLLASGPVSAASFYTTRPDDPRAVYLTTEAFGARGDGVADDSEAVQRAIDKVQETTGQGVVLIPEGRYRITRTIHVWPGVRVIGYGARRPVLVLADSTPGFQDAAQEKQMVFFAGERPERGSSAPPPDANPGTFYSALSNVDVEVGTGNDGAVGVRGTYAQHSFLAHMAFRLQSGIAGVHDSGNVMEDVRFVGGRYGVWSRQPSPGWQLTLVDAVFEGQKEAGVRETTAGLTLVRPTFRNLPTAVSIDEGATDYLWIKDARLETLSGPAFVISGEASPRNQINMEDVACRDVSVFALFRDSGRRVAGPGAMYQVGVFSHGLAFADANATGRMQDIFQAAPLRALPPPPASDLWPLPPMETWVNIRALGAKGDGATDDTEAFRRAIAEHKAIYLPTGRYRVSDTLTLKPDTVLIGLHPSTTQIGLLDRTPAFQGVGAPKPMIEAPKGGSNIIIGVGLYTNGINPRATALQWMAGTRSMLNDVRFHGGHGTQGWDGSPPWPYNNNQTGDRDPARRWDSQYPSLWVTDGGGGTFFDIWTPSSFAQAGMMVSNTSTEGRVYQLSSEHHVRHEVQLRDVANWRFYALQTEAERGESGFMLPLEIERSKNITIANTHMYRVISSYQPYKYAIRVSDSQDIRIRNVHSDSNSKVIYDALLRDDTHDAEVRQHEFAWLNLTGAAPGPFPAGPSPVRAQGQEVVKLAGGFFNISGGAVDAQGDYYFVDQHWQKIYRWSAVAGRLSTILDAPIEPVNLAIDRSGEVLVVSYQGDGTVLAFRPGEGPDRLRTLAPTPAVARPDMTAILPVNTWEFDAGHPAQRPFQYVSPDGSVYLSAGQDFVAGATSWGIKSADLVRGFGLGPARPGQPYYISNEHNVVTWVMDVLPDGNLANLRPFVRQGGESVAVDSAGNVYIANGDIFVYSSAGKLIDRIRTPERPTNLAFGGADRRTLFIAARSGLYALRTEFAGRP